MKKILLLFLTCLVFSYCKKDTDASYFNGKITIIKDSCSVVNLTSQQIFLNDIYTGGHCVFDSIIMFMSNKYPHHFVSAFSLNSGDMLGEFILKGKGPNEYIMLGWTGQYIFENDEFKIWFNAVSNYRMVLLNLTASIREKRTVIDREIKFGVPNSPNGDFFQYIFCTNEKIVAKTQTAWFDKSKPYTPAEYYSFDVNDLRKSTKFTLFNKPLIVRDRNIYGDDSFISSDCIKPDQTKIAMAMCWTKQINILDLTTGQLNGYRIENSTEFLDLNSSKPLFYYYDGLEVDDKYIFVLNFSAPLADQGTEHYHTETTELHVLSWDGKFIAKVLLDHPSGTIAFDSVNKYLYTKDKVEENIYRYDLKFLYE